MANNYIGNMRIDTIVQGIEKYHTPKCVQKYHAQALS